MSILDAISGTVSATIAVIVSAPDLAIAVVEVVLGSPELVVAILSLFSALGDRIPFLSSEVANAALTVGLIALFSLNVLRFARKVGENK